MHTVAELMDLVEDQSEYVQDPVSIEHNDETEKNKGNIGVMSQPPLTWKPFPVNLLPEPLAAWVIRHAEAIPCDPAMVAVPLLTVLASIIGATRRIMLKLGWPEPSVLWTAIIAPSGGAKSPALDAALGPVREIERTAHTPLPRRTGPIQTSIGGLRTRAQEGP